MIRIQDSKLIDYFSNLQEGQTLSKEDVALHQNLFNVNFDSVVGESDYNNFTVTNEGEISKLAGIVQRKVGLAPVLDSNNDAGRKKAAKSFSENIDNEIFGRARGIIQMELIRSNGALFGQNIVNLYGEHIETNSNGLITKMTETSVSFPESTAPSLWDTGFHLKGKDKAVRSTLSDFTLDDLRGTSLYESLYTETLLGKGEGLVYDSGTRSFIQSNNLPAAKTEAKPKAKANEVADETKKPEVRTLTEKIQAMNTNSAATYHDDSDSIAEILRNKDMQEISAMENMSPSQLLHEHSDIREYIERMDVKLSVDEESRIQAEVDKVLGVDAPQSQKDSLIRQLKFKKEQELKAKEVAAFKKNAKSYAIEFRDYLSETSARHRDMDDENAMIFEEQRKRGIEERKNDKYIERFRNATHIQQEDGSWVRKHQLPNRQTDKIRQAISIDMGGREDMSAIVKNLQLTFYEGKAQLDHALDHIEESTSILKEMNLAFSEGVESGDLVAGEELHTTAYNRVEQQKAVVDEYKDIILNKGYRSEYGKTSYNKDSRKLEQIGLSFERYLEYLDDDKLLKKDVKELKESSRFEKERIAASNTQSWYRAMENGSIVKGSYNDERGYVVNNIDSSKNIAYVSAPALKVSDLHYTTDITNRELLANIEAVDEEFTQRFNPQSVASDIDPTLSVSDFEDIDNRHISVFANIPDIKKKEDLTPEAIERIHGQVDSYARNPNKSEYSYLPDWATNQIDGITETMNKERQILDRESDRRHDNISAFREKFEKDSWSPELQELLDYQQKAQADISQLKAQHSEIMSRALSEIKTGIVSERQSYIQSVNEKLESEMKVFGFKQESGEARFSITKKDFEETLLGTDRNISKFARTMIDSHFTHLNNEKGNGHGSIFEAIMSVSDDHVAFQTEFDLRDSTMIRNYMWTLNADALSVKDLNDRDKLKLDTYAKSLGDKGILDRLQDSLFGSIVRKGFETEYGSGGESRNRAENMLKTVMDTLKQQGVAESDMSGLYIRNQLHDKDSALFGRIGTGYQSEILKMSDTEIDKVITDLRSVGNTVSTDELASRGYEQSNKADDVLDKLDYYEREGMIDEYQQEFERTFGTVDNEFDEFEKKSSTKISQFDEALSRIGVVGMDTSKLNNVGIDTVFSSLKEKDADKWTGIERAYKLAGKAALRKKSPEDILKNVDTYTRLEMYARGAHAGQERQFKKLLGLKDLAAIDPNGNLMNDALSSLHSDTLNDRQLGVTIQLAEKLGKKVEAKIPLPDGSFTNGYLRFNENNEIEAYSPALKQSYVVNDTGTASLATVDIERSPAFNVNNRLEATSSYSKQQPILKQSVANEAQMKRNGVATVISNVDASFGELVDFVEKGKKGISYDIETTMTGAKHLSDITQPIEIFAQQIQFDKETGELMKNADGQYVVEDTILNKGGSTLEPGTHRVAKEYHAIASLEDGAKDLINRIAATPDYFNISVRDREKVHIADYIDAYRNKASDVSHIDFVKEIFGATPGKTRAKEIVAELGRKSEEFQFLNNVAKYAFGADKTREELKAFGDYSNSKAVFTEVDFAAHLKKRNIEMYNSFFDKNGALNKDMDIAFNRELYEFQNTQTDKLVKDAVKASANLDDLSFNYGDGVQRVNVKDALIGFEEFTQTSGADVIFGQNLEKADNKTLVETAKLLEKRTKEQIAHVGEPEKTTGWPTKNTQSTDLAEPTLGSELGKIRQARQKLFDDSIRLFTEEYGDKFGVNPLAAEDHQRQLQEVLADPSRDKAGYLNSKNKIWVSNLTEALQFIPEMNRSNSNIRFDSSMIKSVDAEIGTLTSLFDKLSNGDGNFTPVEEEMAQSLDLFGGNKFALSKNAAPPKDLVERMTGVFDNLGVVDQQNITRVAYPGLESQSNGSLMKHLNVKSDLAHDGKFDTVFTSTNIGNMASQIHQIYNGDINPSNQALANVLLSIDKGASEDGASFMERNSYRGDGTEFVSFASQPDAGVQKGVYRLDSFNEDGTSATFSRVVMGEKGPIIDTSVEPYKMEALTNPELAHRFAGTVRHVEAEQVGTEIELYNQDISRRHFEKVLNNNMSYDSHINQIRQMEIQGGVNTGIFEGNPLFNIDSEIKGASFLDLDQDELVEASGKNGALQLSSNPIERARGVHKDSIMKRPKLKDIVGTEQEAVELDDIERNLLRNGSLLQDASKEKFYNKDISKEQMLALQEMDIFNSTELGGTLSELMDNVTALESQGTISKAEKANILSSWNDELKAKAESAGHTYAVKDAAVVPDFMLKIKDKTSGDVKSIPIQSTMQVSSPTEIANSLRGIAKTINKHVDYSNAKNVSGLKEDRAINDKLMKPLRDAGVVKADQFLDENGKHRFVGLGELSHTIYNNLQENPELMKPVRAVDYMGMALDISPNDLDSLQTKTSEILAPFMKRLTDKQAVQMEGLIDSKKMMQEAGVYIPGMKLVPGEFNDSEAKELRKYMKPSFMNRMSTDELVSRADDLAGGTTDASKAGTKLIYRELMNRASMTESGGRSIDPAEIIKSGDRNRIDAAVAMNWIEPVRDSNMIYRPVDDIGERRIGYGQMAGAKMKDLPLWMLNAQATHAMESGRSPFFERDLVRQPHMQQQQQILDWRDDQYRGHDGQRDKYRTARGEAPRATAPDSADIIRGANEEIVANHSEGRRNAPVNVDDELAEVLQNNKPQRTESPQLAGGAQDVIANNANINIQQPVSEEDVLFRSKTMSEMVSPTEPAKSGLEQFISRSKADIGESVGHFLEGGNGGKWVAGLGVAAAALFAVNAANSPMKLETRPAGHGVKGVTGTPEDDTDRSNKQAESRETLQSPQHQQGGTSYVTSGDKGYTIKASGKAPSNIDSSQLQSTINNSMSGTNGVNINLRDDRSTLDGSWLESQFSNFIERGSVGG